MIGAQSSSLPPGKTGAHRGVTIGARGAVTVYDANTNPLPVTGELRVTAADLPAEPERLVIRSEDLDTLPVSPAGQVWVAVDFSSLGWMPTNYTVPQHVSAGGYDLRPFVPGAALSS